MPTTFFGIATLFIIYSFAGWVMESIFRSICEKKIINTGFLTGPFCPIYGIGALILTVFCKNFGQMNLMIVFILSVIVMSAWEYVVGIYLEKVFHTKYWDYSHNFMNYKGRLCLFNSLCWGVLGVIFYQFIYPMMSEVIVFIMQYPHITNPVVLAVGVVVLADAITSCIKVKNIELAWSKIHNINDQIKELKEKLEQITIVSKEKGKEKKKQIAENIKEATPEAIQEMIEDLKKRKNKILRRLYRLVYRLKKAFPTIDTKVIREILNKKSKKE